MRPRQWFKSASIFFGTVVAVFLYGYEPVMITKTIIAFIGISLLSSTAYVLNDLADKESDKKHPIKKKRPIASGKITETQAIIIATLLLTISLTILYCLNIFLLIIGIIFIINNTLYSFKPFRLKNKTFFDVITAGLDFPLRVLIGWYSITTNIVPSSVLLFPFFIACFLLSVKRKAEKKYLGKKAGKVKKVYKKYTKQMLEAMINTFMGFASIYYFLFSFLLTNYKLFYISPVFIFLMAWYKNFSEEKNSVVKKPEQIFTRKKKFTIIGVAFTLTWIAILLFF